MYRYSKDPPGIEDQLPQRLVNAKIIIAYGWIVTTRRQVIAYVTHDRCEEISHAYAIGQPTGGLLNIEKSLLTRIPRMKQRF
jgi:hypothetical protein